MVKSNLNSFLINNNTAILFIHDITKRFGNQLDQKRGGPKGPGGPPGPPGPPNNGPQQFSKRQQQHSK